MYPIYPKDTQLPRYIPRTPNFPDISQGHLTSPIYPNFPRYTPTSPDLITYKHMHIKYSNFQTSIVHKYFMYYNILQNIGKFNICYNSVLLVMFHSYKKW